MGHFIQSPKVETTVKPTRSDGVTIESRVCLRGHFFGRSCFLRASYQHPVTGAVNDEHLVHRQLSHARPHCAARGQAEKPWPACLAHAITISLATAFCRKEPSRLPFSAPRPKPDLQRGPIRPTVMLTVDLGG